MIQQSPESGLTLDFVFPGFYVGNSSSHFFNLLLLSSLLFNVYHSLMETTPATLLGGGAIVGLE